MLLLHPIGSSSSCFCCYLFLYVFSFPQWSIGYFVALLFSFHVFVVFLQLFSCNWSLFFKFYLLYLIYNHIELWSENNFHFLKFTEALFVTQRCDLSWRRFRVLLRRKCILLLLDGMSYKYQFSLSGPMFHLRLLSPY